MKVFFLAVALVAGWGALPAGAVDVDNRTLPAWTNYFNSKTAFSGPKSPGWSKDRGDQAILEEDLRRKYFQAVASGDEGAQELALQDLMAVNPRNPEYPLWKKQLEDSRRAPEGEKKTNGKGNGAAGSGRLTNGVGRLSLPGPEYAYEWDLVLPPEAQTRVLEELDGWRRKKIPRGAGCRSGRALPRRGQTGGGG